MRPPPSVATTSAGVTVAWVVAGTLLLSSAATRWFRMGPGSRFRGLALADNIRNGTLSPSWGVWVALGVYSVIGVGGIFIGTAALRHRGVVLARGAVSVVGVALFVLLGSSVAPRNWSAGPTMSSVAFLLATVLTAVQLSSDRRR